MNSKKVASLGMILIAMLSANSIYAEKLTGVDWIRMEINGVEYDIPQYNPDVKNEQYMLAKALEGDKIARKMLLGGNKEKWIFIGDGEVVRWLHLTEDSERVVEYGKEKS